MLIRAVHVPQINTKTWKETLKRPGIADFRWHDLRHTWGSRHVQNGTALYTLQDLTGQPAIEIEGGYCLTSSTACWRCGHSAAFAVLIATIGTEWLGGESTPIDEPVIVSGLCDRPPEQTSQVLDLVPSICRPPEDDPYDQLTSRCSHCEALLGDWHLCKIGGALFADDGTPRLGATATRLAAPPPVSLNDSGIVNSNVQALLDASRKADRRHVCDTAAPTGVVKLL